ncbi:MAG: ATP-binding protein [Methanomassiliicoccaceae archaeon]|nr:ATP-binding protein [Methanomassiliicoccaceae archaeon]
MFYGREQELKKMNSLYDTGEHQLVVVYGRRRVGKTTLINEFCKGKRTLFFPALESTAEKNLKVFSNTINKFIYPDSSVDSEYASFDDAFTKISEAAEKERFVFVIDEFPYLAAADSSVQSVLQHLTDHKFSKTNIFMILCGSSMSFMENQVLGQKSPLYGRRTAQFRLEPLSYLKAAEAHPHLSPESNAVIYGITGGIPHYINKLAIKNDGDIGNSIVSNILDTTSYLFEEPANLLKQELREPATYNAIISAIAGGASRLSDIANKTLLNYAVCSKYMSVLLSLKIAGKKAPVYGNMKNKTLYYLKDNLFNFWYSFIPDNISQIMAGKAELVYKNEVEPKINQYMGFVFEDICRQYLINYAKGLPVRIKNIGDWWGGNPKTKEPEEVDIIAFSGKEAIFGECKWWSDPVDLSVLKEIKRKAELFPDFKKKYYYLFSRSGFTSAAIKEAEQDPSVRLITLAEIYGV